MGGAFTYAGSAVMYDSEGRPCTGVKPEPLPPLNMAPPRLSAATKKPSTTSPLPGVPDADPSPHTRYYQLSRAFYPRCQVSLRVILEGTDGVFEYIVIPKDIDVDRNHHRSADTFTMTLDYRDFPLDPRAIKSLLITALLGDVVIPTGELIESDKYRAFIGYADEPETVLEEGGEIVRLKGRDYTALFLDHRWEGGSIDVRVPLRQCVKRILEEVPGALPVFGERTYFIGDEDGDPGSAIIANMIGRKRYIPQAGDDTWTVLVDLCGRAGFVPAIELDRLMIRTPNQVGQAKAELTYGVDVSRLSFKRKLVSAQTKQIEVRCWDDHAARSTSVKWPTEPMVEEKKVTISKEGETTVDTSYANVIPFYVQGPYSRDALEQIARSIFEDLAREQIDAVVETREMLDRHGEAMWLLGNGDQLKIVLGKPGQSSIQGMDPAAAIASLTAGSRGYLDEVARALVAASKLAADLGATFYVKSAQHHWDREQGYRLTANIINMVTAQ